ncbi:MAG: hypothetical protein HWN65_01755 [Candidatus Helarchaeota archaeon]|nr:hypothetical protein [Candidatus Helarchaeota archaeon]
MDSQTRVLTALNHEDPDRVPLLELGIDSIPVIRKYRKRRRSARGSLIKMGRSITGWKGIYDFVASRPLSMGFLGERIVNFFKKIGYDVAVVPVSLFLHTFFSSTEYVDECGRKFKFSKLESGDKQVNIAYYDGGYFDTEDPEATYDEFDPLDPDLKAREAAYVSAVQAAKRDIYVVPAIQGFLEPAWEAFGFTTFTKLLYSKPEFIERVFRERGDFSVAVAENMMNLGAETILLFDDAGLKHSTFLSPKMYEGLVVPQLKRICDKVHSYDGKLILHSCGNLYKILDLIIGAGIDALHPWESTAGMDIFKAKEDYGTKLTLIGNVPLDLLTHGTPQEVETYVKKLMKVCAPGGGYILSSGHSIAHSVTLENYEAMLEAARKYGTYPINL